MKKIEFMPDTEFKELVGDFLEFRHGFDYRDMSDRLYDQLTKHRKLVLELAHRLNTVEELLKRARCPSGCERDVCAWCWDRNIELEAINTYHKELGI